MKCAFLWFQQYSISLYGFQDLFNIHLMLLKGVAVNENIVKGGCTEHIKVVTDAIVNKVLEGGLRIDKAERHHRIFEMPVTCAKDCFPFFTLSYSDLVILLAKVKFGVPFVFGEAVESLPDERQRVAVLDGKFIEATIIDGETEFSISLFKK
jgi:hypothetical protein